MCWDEKQKCVDQLLDQRGTIVKNQQSLIIFCIFKWERCVSYETKYKNSGHEDAVIN